MFKTDVVEGLLENRSDCAYLAAISICIAGTLDAPYGAMYDDDTIFDLSLAGGIANVPLRVMSPVAPLAL